MRLLLSRPPKSGPAECEQSGLAGTTASLGSIAAASVVAMSAALLWNAATTNFWDDEVMGYLLCRAPFAEVMRLMANNVHHDPPLFEVVQQPWVQLVGPNVFLLRIPAFVYWAIALL